MVSVAFFGSHPLGEACLERLVAHDELTVDTVVTYPRDHESWWNGSVHERAREHDLPVLTTDEEAAVVGADIDYLLSVYYPNILGPDLLETPRQAALNLHQAELPRYRGSNVFSHSIMNARPDDHWRHGTTLHVMAEDVDAGDVIDRKFVPITEEDTARTLYERVRGASIELFEDCLPAIAAREIDGLATPQSAFGGKRYFYTKDSLDDLKEIPPEKLAASDTETQLALYDRVRALDFPPHEPAWTRLGDRKLYLTKSDYEQVLPG
ncbi:methionyl-tRNA formyltransferase (plasmid) [Halorientalis pallida]|uniref:methionyl-tRNA formyltransferase n=1 Tax=Halorientalis pallida TaxID=2479928 RepID=UPI003C705F56